MKKSNQPVRGCLPTRRNKPLKQAISLGLKHALAILLNVLLSKEKAE